MKVKTKKLLIVCMLFLFGYTGVAKGQQLLEPGKNKVTYQSNGKKISALLYLPEDYKEGEQLPAIVITRPGSGVKEQTAGLYAETLSKKGFVTLAFDPRGFGESEGHPLLENPYKIAEDTKNSVSFIRTLPQVDKEKVFNVGICMGAGYAAYATAFDARVTAFAMISPYLNAKEQNIESVGGPNKVRSKILPAAAKARQKYYEKGEDMYTSPVPTNIIEMAMALPIQIGMRDYYLPGRPGDVPNWRNKLSTMSTEYLLTFSAFNYSYLLKQVPYFLAVGSEAYTFNNTMEFYEGYPGVKDKIIVDGAGHFELYWMPEYVSPVAEGVANFFKAQINTKKTSSSENAINNSVVNNELIIYPNPVKEELFIQFDNSTDLIEVSVIASDGRTVLNKNIRNGQKLNVFELQTGMYILKAKSGSKTKMEKFLIQK